LTENGTILSIKKRTFDLQAALNLFGFDKLDLCTILFDLQHNSLGSREFSFFFGFSSLSLSHSLLSALSPPLAIRSFIKMSYRISYPQSREEERERRRKKRERVEKKSERGREGEKRERERERGISRKANFIKASRKRRKSLSIRGLLVQWFAVRA